MEISNEKMYNFFNYIASSNDFWIENVSSKYKKNFTENCGFSIASYMDVYKNYNNLQLIYTKEEATKQINMVENIQSTFSKYFEIPGLERLISTNYTDVEWSMFLEQNFEKNEPKRTRDHFQHQFRNAFLGCELLYEFNFIENIIKCIKDKETVFSFLINKTIEKHMSKTKTENRYKEEIIWEDCAKEIVFKSFLLAAIFHDIGYPISYFFRESRQIHKFTPFYKIINSNIKTDFVEIKAILVDSQLFSIIDSDEIEEKYKKNDHGVFSAMSFLLNFYQAGSIFSMSDIDRCIIEMSAVAMYNHTNEYKENNERMVFNDDPLSYLLRLCDDLQEWSRFSLSVNSSSNMLRCECFAMIRRLDGKSKDEKNTNIKYKCQCEFCGREFDKISSLEYKKIHYLNLCDKMEISKDDDGVLNIEIKYDKFKQLELLLNDYTSVKYRDDDLKEVERMLSFQKNLPDIKLVWFLSNNPCELVRRLLLGDSHNNVIITEKLLSENKKLVGIINTIRQKNQKLLNDFISELNNETGYGNKTIETDEIKYYEKSREFVTKYIGLIKVLYDSIES